MNTPAVAGIVCSGLVVWAAVAWVPALMAMGGWGILGGVLLGLWGISSLFGSIGFIGALVNG